MKTKPNFIELCAGAGGLSSGLQKAGFTPILLNDIDKNCCNTLRQNHKKIRIEECSFTDIDFTPFRNKVDILCSGNPCQSFSQAGLRRGMEDPRGHLLISLLEVIKQVNPKMFLIENVKGLLTHNNGDTFSEYLEMLNELDYEITYKLLNAFDYEVPQKRERVFIVGIRKDIFKKNGEFEFPKVSSKKIVLRDIIEKVSIIENEKDYKRECSKYPEEKIKLFKMIPQGSCWTSLPENLQRQYLGNSYNSTGGKRGILHRLSMDKPSLTLLCSPSQKQTERCHPLEERPLSILEYALIQTFDEDYIFTGSLSSKYKQIGNAVPVRLSYFLGLSIKKYIE